MKYIFVMWWIEEALDDPISGEAALAAGHREILKFFCRLFMNAWEHNHDYI
jgi:hypothetical protein